MYMTINGWTKAKMIEAIQTKMLDHVSAAWSVKSESMLCAYQAPDGNRCAVGVFMPDGHSGLGLKGGAGELLDTYPDLIPVMPLPPVGLSSMQAAHDTFNNTSADPRPAVIQWINDNVVDAV